MIEKRLVEKRVQKHAYIKTKWSSPNERGQPTRPIQYDFVIVCLAVLEGLGTLTKDFTGFYKARSFNWASA